MRAELLKGLTEAQIEKLKACKNNEEILMAAKEEGIELNDEQLEAVSGGACDCYYVCDRCGSDLSNRFEHGTGEHEGYFHVRCNNCGFTWWVEDY